MPKSVFVFHRTAPPHIWRAAAVKLHRLLLHWCCSRCRLHRPRLLRPRLRRVGRHGSGSIWHPHSTRGRSMPASLNLSTRTGSGALRCSGRWTGIARQHGGETQRREALIRMRQPPCRGVVAWGARPACFGWLWLASTLQD
jgi:hypothetical protein